MNDLPNGEIAVAHAVVDNLVYLLCDIDRGQGDHDRGNHQADRDYELGFEPHLGHSTPPTHRSRAKLLVGSLGQAAAVRTVLLQLIVQSLQADAENLRGTRLIVV